MTGHSHDGIDWDTRIRHLREGDELAAEETARMARDLLADGAVPVRSVTDIGAGAGGSAAAFARTMSERDGAGVVTIVDSAPELLAAATGHAREAAGAGVEIRAVETDAADDAVRDAVEPADLVFASFVVHHLPDQLAGLRRLAALVRPGGRLVIVESGVGPRTLPWDVGVGQPGLEERLAVIRHEWFREMRSEMPGSVRLPVGWPVALEQAGLTGVRSWSHVIDRPAPTTAIVRTVVLRRLEWLLRAAAERASADDVAALEQLLDPDSAHYVGHRSDLHYLVAHVVHVATRPATT